MRERLPERRSSENIEIYHQTFGGSSQKLIITCGFNLQGKVSEVFTAAFKSGGDTNAIIADTCVLISILLQHGYSAKQLAERLSTPQSLIGTVIRSAAAIED